MRASFLFVFLGFPMLALAGHNETVTNNTSSSYSGASSDNEVTVRPSRLLLNLGGGGSGSDSTAVCLERRPSWGFGFRGDKTVLNAECWSEHLAQAAHERAIELERLQIERLRLEIERDRLKLDSVLAEQCIECDALK